MAQCASWNYKRRNCLNYTAYQEKIEQGLLTHKNYTFTKPDGDKDFTEQIRIDQVKQIGLNLSVIKLIDRFVIILGRPGSDAH